MHVTPDQIRAARALLRLDQTELARRAHVSIVTVRRLEGANGQDRVAPGTLDGIRTVLEQAGAEFIPDGVRRRTSVSDTDLMFQDLRTISLQSAERLKGHDILLDADLYDEEGLPA